MIVCISRIRDVYGTVLRIYIYIYIYIINSILLYCKSSQTRGSDSTLRQQCIDVPRDYSISEYIHPGMYLGLSISVERTAELTAIIATAAAAAVPAIKKIG